MKRKAFRRKRSARVMRMTLVLSAIVLVILMLPTKVTSNGDETKLPVSTEEPVEQNKLAETEGVLVPLVNKVTYNKVTTDAAEPETTTPVVEREKLYTEADVIALAKMAWGEALVTKSDTEMAATMWCVLNRFDSDDPYYRSCKTIESVVKQSGAFAGYSARNPEDEHLIWLARDVLDRWNAEQHGETDVGRVLPEDYLFFHGDTQNNHFRKEFGHDGYYWDWSLESPYET